MIIFVKAKTNSKMEKVERTDSLLDNETHFKVFVKEPPVEGKANKAIIKAIASYLKIAPSRVEIIRGLTSKEKVMEIN
jgi:hypothetical protein